ncbi:CLF1 [Mytilus edulis]|uniref:CRN n=1 Tax=Mytilus edulis TaxID=6550 RepID=A0A8S3V0W1_MYTED|nr:CLF1 [Mytilus edulis]
MMKDLLLLFAKFEEGQKKVSTGKPTLMIYQTYRRKLKTNPHNYDAWFDYLRLLEADGNTVQIRETYERAIANVPQSKIIRREEIGLHSEELDFTNIKCDEHAGKSSCLYCNTCKVLVCPTCVAKVHKKHDLIEISDEYKMKVEGLKKRQIKMQKNNSHMNAKKDALKKLMPAENSKYSNSARRVYERAVEFFGEDNIDERLVVAFAKFEEGQKEHERARLIYKYALDHLPKDSCQEIYKHYTVHEKKFGSRAAIEDVIVSKRRFKYEEEKRHWRRYIYLWINYAVYEELENDDPEKVREVFKACLDVIPHKTFTFAKIWLYSLSLKFVTKFTMSQRVMGTCLNNKLYRGYIELELQLREFERCRILYEKFLEFGPENCTSWIKYAELETILGDIDRAEAIYELAINQQQLDMPEVLWKSYIDFQIEQEEFDKVRNLYRRLLQRTKHVKVWISFGQFEKTTGEESCIEKARTVYKEANNAMKSAEKKKRDLCYWNLGRNLR